MALKNSNRIVSVVALSGMLIGSINANAADAQRSFSDIDNHWASSGILNATVKGYVDGYEDGSFKPERLVTRAEFFKMVSTALGVKGELTKGIPWYTEYVNNLKQSGILSDEILTHNIDEPIKRQEMAEIASKAVNTGSKGTMLDAVKEGLITGVENGKLDESGTTTRAQAVTVIERILTKRSGGTLPVDTNALTVATMTNKGTNVEELLGLTPVELGGTVMVAQGVKVKLNQLIIVDPSKPESAFYNMFDVGKY
ncbi:S-layer homology domain-containing protein, partial [Paenibacillus ferrarius]|uniref:S-layer homology domain-containing protein n=1 Tax=Paenibacillus ferrarius TaxID=1469647 RepID=UPI003D2BB3F6